MQERFRKQLQKRGDISRAKFLGLSFCAFLTWLGLFGAEAWAQSPHQLEAAVLGNLAKFVEWPKESFSSTNEPIYLGILGDDPFGADLDTILRSMRAKGRGFVVYRSRNVSDLLACNILFCASGDKHAMREVSAKVGNRAVLLVGEDAGFLDHGGMVRFHTEDRKVRFDINAGAAEAAGLTVHPQLLKLATNITRKEKPE